MRKECKLLHETVVRDIVDVIKNVKDVSDIDVFKAKGKAGSIASRAANLIVVFPVMVPTSCTIETGIMISKAMERKCTVLLQMLFSSVQITDDDTLEEYLSRFHSNLNKKVDLDDFISLMDGLVEEGAVAVRDAEAYKAIREDLDNINFAINTNLNATSLNDYKISQNSFNESSVLLEAPSDNFSAPPKDVTEFFKNQITPTDIKKANELMPTMMMVNFISVSSDYYSVPVTGVIGVKAKLYPVNDMDIINRLASKVTEKNGLFNLVRATTREISFFRDLVFAVDKIKLDAINIAKNDNASKMFRALERRASKNKFSKLLKSNDASPITTLILTQENVEYLKKYNNIDMTKPNTTRTILNAYNLMAIVIVDESLEVAKFMFDDDNSFETLSFDALEKEASDSSYKKVVNLMSKITR